MQGTEGDAPRGAWGSTGSRGASGQLRGTASTGEAPQAQAAPWQGEAKRGGAKPRPGACARDAGVRRDRAPPPFYGSAAAAQHMAAGSGTLRGLLFASEASKQLPQSPWLHRLPPGCLCPSPSSGVEGQLRWGLGCWSWCWGCPCRRDPRVVAWP